MGRFEEWKRDNTEAAMWRKVDDLIKYLYLAEDKYGLDMWSDVITHIERMQEQRE